MMRRRPVIGVSGSMLMAEGSYAVQAAGMRNLEAVAEAADCLPVIVPGMPDHAEIVELLELCDGFLLTGGRANVHPSRYGHAETEKHGSFDHGRDAVVLPLIGAALEAGLPIFGVCRGIQEMNVALGGTLHPEIRELPGRMNHRMPPGEKDPEIIFRKRHPVRLTPGGEIARLVGAEEIVTNSLHGQGVEEAGARVVIEGVAEDGTVEAISIAGARRFAIGVQWHAEYDASADPVHCALWRAFGAAARDAAIRRERRGAA